MNRVTVLGTGLMGAAMTERLLDRGFEVHVWNRTPEPAAQLAERGAVAHTGAADAVRDADVVITMLANGGAVEDVMLRQDVLAAIRPGGVWAQMGTIGVDATESLAAEVAGRRSEVAFVDAPVTCTRGPARNGQLTILASGRDAARAAVDHVFAALGQRVLWLGAAGQGSRMKLVLNTWLAFEVEAAAEVSAAADRLGIPYRSLREAAEGTPLASVAALARLEQIENGDHSANFPLEWALKDLDLVAAAAGTQAVPVAEAIADRWRGLVGQGYGRLDVSAARLGLDSGTKQEVPA